MISLGYPTAEEELTIIENQRLAHPIEALSPAASAEEVMALQEATRGIFVHDLIRQYIVSITGATRSQPDISLGSSPRGSLGLFWASQALAMIRGRDYVLPDDVKELGGPGAVSQGDRGRSRPNARRERWRDHRLCGRADARSRSPGHGMVQELK